MPENVNMRDVARAAGVSPGTVSRVLSNRMGRTRVSVATRQKILDAVRTLDYVPNINARRLFSNRSGVFGLVLPRFDFPMRRMFEDQHLMRILAGIEETISPEGYRVLLIFADRDFVSGKEYLNIFRSKQLDGVSACVHYDPSGLRGPCRLFPGELHRGEPSGRGASSGERAPPHRLVRERRRRDEPAGRAGSRHPAGARRE